MRVYVTHCAACNEDYVHVRVTLREAAFLCDEVASLPASPPGDLLLDIHKRVRRVLVSQQPKKAKKEEGKR